MPLFSQVRLFKGMAPSVLPCAVLLPLHAFLREFNNAASKLKEQQQKKAPGKQWKATSPKESRGCLGSLGKGSPLLR